METAKFVPLAKRSKKARKKHYAAQRNSWNGVVPVTRVIPNRKRAEPRREKYPPDGESD